MTLPRFLYSGEPGMLTWTGRRVSLVHPNPRDICLADIAHHLARVGRYTGAGDAFLSVAQHSVHVSLICPTGLAVAGLLHDAPEAYLNDVSTPLKTLLRGVDDLPREALAVLEGALDAPALDALRDLLPGYRELTRRFEHAIITHLYGSFAVDFMRSQIHAIKPWDWASTLAERRDNGPYGCTDAEWTGVLACDLPAPHPSRVVPVSPEDAEHAFLRRARELGL